MFKHLSFTEMDFENIATAILDENIIRKHFGMIGLRKLLASNKLSVQKVIDAGLLPKII
jgi:hypothetical protein